TGNIGANTALGNVTLNSTNSMTLPSIRTASGKNVIATVTGAGNTLTASTIAVGNNLALTADNLTLNGTLTGPGELLLQPYDVSRDVRVKNGAGDFNLDNSDVSQIQTGWNIVRIGRSNSNANMYLGSHSWNNSIAFQAGSNGTIIIGSGQTVEALGYNLFSFGAGHVDLYGDIIANGSNMSFDTAQDGLHAYGGNVTANGGTVYVQGITVVDSNLNITNHNGNISIFHGIKEASDSTGKTVTLNATNGTLLLNENVDGAYHLTATGNAMSFNNGTWGGTTPLGNVSLTSVDSLSPPSITAASILARTTGTNSDITLASGKVLTSSASGTGITLVAKRHVINQNGSGALVANNGGRWLVYSTNPTDTTGEENLSSDFRRYSCTYGGSCPTLGTGNGLLYSYTPMLDVTPNTVNGTYGQSVNVNGYAYTLSGYLTGDTGDNVTGTLNGTTPYTTGDNAASYDLDYDSGTLTSAMGYGFNYLDRTNGIVIGKANLTITANNISKPYNTSYVFTGTEFTNSTLVSGDSITHVDLTSAGAAAPAAGGTHTINAANATGSGLSNYNISYVTGTLTVTGAPQAPAASTPVPTQVIAVQTTQDNAFTPSQHAHGPAAEEEVDVNAGVDGTDGQDKKSGGNCLYSVVNFKDIPSTSGGCS
ncbi:MAG TPA: MBG domain-containing protein, partial [Alphaproteobacteria bacterium]